MTENEYGRYAALVRGITSGRAEPPLACIHSYGCQQNVSDGEKIAGMLSEMGYGITNDMSQADVIILNTCAVRENAELKVFGNIGELKRLKEQKPELVIGLCGCMAQEQHVIEKIKKSYKQVDMIFGTFAFREMPKLLYTVLTEHKTAVDTSEHTTDIPEDISAVRTDKFKAGVPVMYGCNNFCTYCIVPYVRGRERSRASENILSEIKGLVNDGCREIMLLGQNVNSYGRGLSEDIDFPKLLRMIDEIEGDFRVRFMSPHPKDATKDFIDAIADSKKICKHLHLPLQSGSDRILKAMNRRYTVEDYMKTVDYARSRIPDFSLTTDIIVGFPNETREDFEGTLDVIRRVKYDNIYSFIYSKRSGTKAAAMKDNTSDEDKSAWFREMLEVQREISTEYYKRFIGRTMRVLFDGTGRREGTVTGKSDEFIIVEAVGDSSVFGRFVDVEITSAYNWAVHGRIISK